jgi:two-component system chemotaxis sensor kinase CheA
MNEVIREFILETQENLAHLDGDLIALEKDPTEAPTLARVFRTLHSVKGTAGFLGLGKLQAVAHAAESLLSRLRAGELIFNRPIASAVLKVVDAIREMLTAIETRGDEGEGDYAGLIAELERLRETGRADEPQELPVSAPAVSSTDFEVSEPIPAHPAIPSATIAISQASLPQPEQAAPKSSAVSDSTLRVDVALLDKLMTLVGELVLARNQIVQFSASQEHNGFLGTVQRLNLLTSELQANVMKTRMQPIANVWSKFPRVVRDLAVACGKQVRLDMDGQDTELDKTIIEAIRDPLTHLVRNAVDHGIEPPATRSSRGKPAEGRLFLHAFHEGGKVIIDIADDGGGIDPQRVKDKAIRSRAISAEEAARLSDRELANLIFLPGLSTADKVTQFSGRGVGMDVVRTNIEKIGGSVDVESRLGSGTTVKMTIPLTLAIIPALTVRVAGERYCIPQVSLLELVRLEGEQALRGIEDIHGAPVYRLRGNLLPLVFLDRQLLLPSTRAPGAEINIVVLQADDRHFGLIVDAIHDTEEIVVKPLQKQIKGIAAFAGATIMGDGRVALILDVVGLAQRANVVSGPRGRALPENSALTAEQPSADRQSLLLFATAEGGRMAIPLSLVDRLEEFPRSTVESAGPQYVVQYRGEILPLIHLADALRQRAQKTNAGRSPKRRRSHDSVPVEAGETVQVVVYAGKGRRVGLIVDRIVDVVEEALVSRSPTNRRGVLFTAVIQGRVTEFLDIEEIIRFAAPELFEEHKFAGAKS